MPRIIISIEGVVIKEVQLTRERTTLGRRPYNDVVIDNLAVSGEHAALQLTAGEACLEDLNSTNGTYVNSKAVKKQVLQNNDLIEIGKYRIKFVTKAVSPAAMNTDGKAEAEVVETAPSSLSGVAEGSAPTGPIASIRVLTGASAGREVLLVKPVTKIGKPGVAVAAITRGLRGFVVTGVEGADASVLNGEPLGLAACELKDGDLLELAGTRMAFIQSN